MCPTSDPGARSVGASAAPAEGEARVYDGLDDDGSGRFAFGTGFSDPLAGIDAPVPDGVDGADLGAYCVMLADDALVSSHRLTQWLTRAPELEEETALANIALDLLGQARRLYSRAGSVDGTGRDEDAFAYHRGPDDWRNVTFVEPVDADFAALCVRLLVFSCWRHALLEPVASGVDPVLAAVAAAAVTELSYHRHWAARWVVVLGDGTDESRRRVEAGLDAVEAGLGELAGRTGVEERLLAVGVAGDPVAAAAGAARHVGAVLAEARLGRSLPAPVPGSAPGGGRVGRHSAELVGLLDELQGVARAHPGARW